MSEHEKMLERVRALLAKAASTEFEEEAEAFRAKADELMTKHAIAAWQVEQAQGRQDARPEPIVRNMSIDWFYSLDRDLGGGLWSVFLSVTQHTRCKVAWKYASASSRTIPVIGMPADLDYADMLFTHLFMQMVDQMDPKPKPNEPLVEALGRMKEAGLKWEEIFYRLRDAGYYPPELKWNASKMNFAGKYTQYCKTHGRERVYTSPTVYRRSFVAGYSAALAVRLRQQREEQGQSTGSMALALRDISVVVGDKMLELFPAMGQRTRTRAVAEQRLDSGVVQRGHKAGQEATILGNSPGLKRQKELS